MKLKIDSNLLIAKHNLELKKSQILRETDPKTLGSNEEQRKAKLLEMLQEDMAKIKELEIDSMTHESHIAIEKEKIRCLEFLLETNKLLAQRKGESND